MKQKNTLSETYTLMNGINIPKIGLGTWFIPDDEAAAAVCKAVEIGYRHIDTAQATRMSVVSVKVSGIVE